MRLSQRQLFAIFSVFTMLQNQILAAPAGTGDAQALDKRSSGENTVGVNVDARAVTAGPSTENNEPSLSARTTDENSSSVSKRAKNGGDDGSSGTTGGETTSSGNDSDDSKKKAKLKAIKARKRQIIAENEAKEKKLVPKGMKYEQYDPNDINIV
ncbi:MAG: hypothetical protein M1820_009330 [Bogoriella megaspora]|nr:MAG: hypothetical protein M1820_009330 [Bogoriella megaspora]